MAKKQLKKLNQPKKYLQGGSNMGSVSMMRQNPYYLGQVEKNKAEEKLDDTRQQAMDIRQTAVQAKADAKAQQKAEMDQAVQQSVGTIGQAAIADKKAGNLGKFFINSAPTVIGNTNPFAFMQASTPIGTGTAIEGVGVLAPEFMPAGQAGIGTAVDAGVGVLAPEFIAPAADAGNIVTSAGSTTGAGLSGVASAGIGIAANIGGTIIRNRTNDDSAYTFTDKERRGNTAGRMLSSAGTGFGVGNMFLPGVGGLIGAGIGAGIGAIKAKKENKAAEEEAKRLQREQSEIAAAYQSANINSRLTGIDTGFGLNSSTNMNNQFTNQYQVARTGGVTGIQEDRRTKKVPGGKIVPIEGTDAVEFVGRTHAQGGILIDKNTEVEGGGKDGQGETMDQVVMNDNNKQDYIFSKYLKLGGKSFAQRHKEILKGSGSQADIQQLAAMQEKVAGRNPQQVAAYGGFHKYLEGGAPVAAAPTACPEGYIRTEWGSCEPAGYEEKQEERWKTFEDKYGDAIFENDTRGGRKFDRADEKIDKEFFGTKDRWKNISDQEGTEGETIFLTKEDSRKEKKGKLNLTYPAATGVKPAVDNQTVIANQNGVSNAPVDNTTKPQAVTQTTSNVDPQGNKLPDGYVWNATLNAPVSSAATSAASTTKGANAPNAAPDWDTKKKSIIDQVNSTPDMLVEPDKKAQIIEMLNSPDPKMRDQGMYIFDLYSQVQVGQTVDPKATPATGYNPTPGITPPAATTNTGTNTSTNTNAGTIDDPTVTYTNSKDPNAPGVTQTPEEKEAARLAGLPRIFAGAIRTVDPTTGKVTVDKGRLITGQGAMAGSRLGTATGSQDDLAKVTTNSYDQAWQNKADNLYTNQKDASGGGLSSSDAIADRDKIAESNWGQKYGYKKGMSADEAKAAHGKFATDVKSLFANNPDEMMSYFQYIIDGGDPNTKEDATNKKAGTYLGKDAEQIRTNLTKQGYIDANGQPIAGKVINGKTMAQYLEDQATNNAVGPIHNALGSYTAERSGSKIKLKEGEKKKDEVVTQELPKSYEPCPPGTYRSTDGTCKDVGDVPQGTRINGSLVAGLGQLIPIGAALMNPYKIAPGIVGAPSVKGPLMQRNNMNQDRAAAIQQNVAYKNAVLGQNAGPAALVAMQSANAKTDQQMLQIAKQEQDTNRQLAAEEGKMGMQASMFNAENQQKTQMFNTEFNQKERQYRREDLLGALDTGAARIAGIVKDDRAFKAQERYATASDETGSYQRFTTYEDLAKDAKRKNSPYYGKSDSELRRIAAAMYKELNPEGYISKSEYTKLQEENAKMKKEQEEAAKKNQAKFGGARQYVSRLGQLSGVRATKAKI